MICRQRLDIKHIQSGTGNHTLLQRTEQGGLIDNRGARGINQQGGGLHLRQFLRTQQAARAFAEHQMNGHHIAGLQ
ncbi:hypothetical protein SRABI106_02021 [Rahnella aquatilis]|nr:hypothetical protein SRABI106_02021 [Rahnella aquatilis]